MADGRHLGKIEKLSHLGSSSTDFISMKFGPVTQFDPLELSEHYKFELLQIQDGGKRHLEKLKMSVCDVGVL